MKLHTGSNFHIEELVSPYWMGVAANPDHVLLGLRSVNPAMIEGVQLIRNTAGESVTVNDWHREGAYEESGLRTPQVINAQKFAVFSSHMFWLSLDLKFKSMNTADMYNFILQNNKLFHMITAMEDVNYTRSSKGKLGRDWLHVVFGYRKAKTPIRLFKP